MAPAIKLNHIADENVIFFPPGGNGCRTKRPASPRDEIGALEYVFVPINHKEKKHWSLVVIHMQEKVRADASLFYSGLSMRHALTKYLLGWAWFMPIQQGQVMQYATACRGSCSRSSR